MTIRDHGASGLLPGLCLSVALLGLLGVAGGCGEPAAGKLAIREPQVTLTPGAGTGAAYLTVFNPGSRSDRLLRVETAAARLAEIHETIEENGVVRMEARPDGLEVPAGGTLDLQPGGKHIMLIEPKMPADTKAPVTLTLHFERAGPIEVHAALGGHAGDHSGDHSGHAGDHGGGS